MKCKLVSCIIYTQSRWPSNTPPLRRGRTDGLWLSVYTSRNIRVHLLSSQYSFTTTYLRHFSAWLSIYNTAPTMCFTNCLLNKCIHSSLLVDVPLTIFEMHSKYNCKSLTVALFQLEVKIKSQVKIV